MPEKWAGAPAPATSVPPKEVVLSFVRRPQGLSALVCLDAAEAGGSRALVERRLPDPKIAAPVALVEAWGRLARGRAPDRQVCADVLTVWLSSVPATDAGPCGADPGPSIRRGRPVDWRLHAADPRVWPGLRAAVEEQWDPILRGLERAGLGPRGALHRLRGAAEPYLAFHHGREACALRSLPRPFVQALLPALTGRPSSVVKDVLGSYFALDLGRSPSLLASVALLVRRFPETAAGWLNGLRLVEQAHRAPHLDVLVGADSLETATELDIAALAALACEGASAEDAPHRWRLLVDLAAQRWGMEDLRAALVVARQLASDDDADPEEAHHFWLRFHGGQPLRPGYAAALERLLPHLGGFAGYHGIHLLNMSRRIPRLARAIGSDLFLVETPALAKALLRFQAYPHVITDRGYRERQLPRIEAVLRAAAPDRLQEVSELVDIVVGRWDDAATFAGALDTVLALAARVERGPGPQPAEVGSSLTTLVKAVGPKGWSRLLSVPLNSLRRLRVAHRLDSRAARLGWGLKNLARVFPDLALVGFERHPECLFRAARAVGILSDDRAGQVLRSLRGQALFRKGLEEAPPAVLQRLVLEAAGARSSVIPRRLRLHFEGTLPLSDGSLERHRRTVARRLVRVRLLAVERAVIEGLERTTGLAAAGEVERHAMLFSGAPGPGRRILGRALRAHARGDTRFVDDHPVNQQWMARHPQLRTRAWQPGFSFEANLPGYGAVRIAPERDLLEVLRMGTLVGSCVALGQWNQHSSLAVALDANKQALFLRDRGGRFLARQVVAVSEDDQLVCCPVYPLSAPAPVQAAFLACDASLAEALGMPLCRRQTPEGAGRVPGLLVPRYNDDGIWDRLKEDPPAASA